MEPDDHPERALRSWEKFFNVETVRYNLTIGSVYLTAYEFLLASLVGKLRDSYGQSWTKDGVIVGEDYEHRVLSRHKMPYFASASWFVEMGALDESDVAVLRDIRDHRNFVAHNIPQIVIEPGVEVDVKLLLNIVTLISKLDRWWLQHVEIPSNPDFDQVDVSEQDLAESFSMKRHYLELLVNLAAGDEQPIRNWHDAFAEAWKAGESPAAG